MTIDAQSIFDAAARGCRCGCGGRGFHRALAAAQREVESGERRRRQPRMSYVYEEHRKDLFTERGQFAVCEALLDAQHLASGNGLIPHDRLSDRLPGGDSYARLAIIDRLLELRYLARADNGASDLPRQAWIYRWIARSRT